MVGSSDTRKPRSLNPITGVLTFFLEASPRCENVNSNGVVAFLFALLVSLSGDFGDFSSFVTHMKQIAIVRVVSFCVASVGFLKMCRNAMSICY